MVHTVSEEDGNLVTLLDAEAIDYLIEGLQALRECEPGEEMVTPSLGYEDGSLIGLGDFVLRRAEDDDDDAEQG